MSVELKTYSKFTERVRTKRRRSSVGINEAKSCKKENLLAVIVDSGAYTIKAGLSTDTEPSVIPNCIMKAKSERKRLFIGNQINECRDCSGLYFLLPCERGYITKWDVQKPVWDYVFSKNVCPIEDNPVILTQPVFNFKSIQDCTDEIFFEEYEVPSLFRLNPSDLAKLRYTEEHNISNDTPCIIVDTGFSFTHIIPYINGKKFLNGIRRLNVGGKLLTNHLKDIISYRQYNVMEETYVINQVKEDTCYVAEDIKEELKIAAMSRSSNNIVRNYVLPDFNNIRRGYILDPGNTDMKEKEENCQILRLNNERFIVPEILFHPSDIGMKSMGIAEAVVKSIFCCPSQYQEALAKNIVLIGGSSNFKGFKQRMYAEIRSQLPHLWDINVYQPQDPVTYSWKGGGALLKTPNFKSFLVTKEEYEELGSGIIQQRFNSWMSDNTSVKEEPKKTREEFKYLNKLKDKTIFGKQEPTSINETGTSKDSNEINEAGNAVNTIDEGESTNASEETTQDGDVVNKKTSKSVSMSSSDDQDSRMDDDDLTNHVEIFPFELDSYL